MKKKMTAAVLAAILFLALFALSGCSLFSSGLWDGSSPYDVAVTRGEDGSPESWLSSLGAPSTAYRRAYEEAKEDGSFTGTYYEFLRGLGLDGANGAYVQTALLSSVSVQARFVKANGSEFYTAGGGVIYSLDKTEGDALIVTNYHVVYEQESNGRESVAHISDGITVYLYGGEIASAAIPATYLGGAMEYDIAVLSVQDSPLLKESEENSVWVTSIVAADSDSVTVGEEVYAIGNADGEGMSVTKGVVSVSTEYIDVYAADEKTMLSMLEIRTDAAVNHGNSGGGLFNASGELIGIVNARSEEEGVVGFGYAIPANRALAVAQNIIDTCAADGRARGAMVARLGIRAQVQDSRAVYDPESGKVYIEESVVVKQIDPDTAASASDLRTGDMIAFAKLTSTRGGKPYEREIAVTRLHKLTDLLLEVRRGDKLVLTVSRENKPVTIEFSYSGSAYFVSAQ